MDTANATTGAAVTGTLSTMCGLETEAHEPLEAVEAAPNSGSTDAAQPAPDDAPREPGEQAPQVPEPPSGDGEADGEPPDTPVDVRQATDEAATLPLDTDLDLLSMYVVESLDHIAAAEAALLDLETSPEATEPIHTVFRAFHTIKGTSGFLGLDGIQKLAHLAENLLDRAREGELRLTGGYADLALESCDMLKAMIQDLEGLEPGAALEVRPGYPGLLARLADPEAAGADDDATDRLPSCRASATSS